MPTDPEHTWPRDLDVLRFVVAKLQTADEPVSALEVARDLSLDREAVYAAYKNLHRGGYVIGARNERTISMHVFDITERALTATGTWPTPETALDRMIAALDDIADHTEDPETKTRAQKIRTELATGSKAVGIGLVTALAKHLFGI